MENFQDVIELNREEEIEHLSFPISREKLITDTGIKTNRDVIVTAKDNVQIGIVKHDHKIVPYANSLKWLNDEFQSTGVDYKLRESVVMKNCDFYQEYIFDQKIDTPDDSDMAPMVLVKGSYIKAPLCVDFGTFRFTCANGMVVGRTVEQVKIKANVGPDFLQSSILDDIRYSMDRFAKVTKLYSHLGETNMDLYLTTFLTHEAIAAYVKRLVLEMLKNQGSIEILVEKIKKEDLLHNPNAIYNTLNDVSAWTLYNILTQVVTHKARNVNGRTSLYNQISTMFNI